MSSPRTSSRSIHGGCKRNINWRWPQKNHSALSPRTEWHSHSFLRLASLCYRQRDDQGRPSPCLAYYLNGALMQLHDFFGDRQSQPAAFSRTLPRRVCLIEALKDMCLRFLRNTDACIRNPAFDGAALPMRLHAHPSAIRGKFDTIVQEVAPHLAEQILIGDDFELFQGHVHVKCFGRPLRLIGYDQGSELFIQA